MVGGNGQPTVFPADSYLQLEQDTGVWTADVFDASDTLLASVPASDVVMNGSDGNTEFEMHFRGSLTKYDMYRGGMHLTVEGSGVRAINVVSMNDYVKGVVPAEMPPLWPLEAVKAQAVAARSYAYVAPARPRLRRRAHLGKPGLRRALWCWNIHVQTWPSMRLPIRS